VITRENVSWRGVGEYGHQVEEVRVAIRSPRRGVLVW
jgi:hypothetical protein